MSLPETNKRIKEIIDYFCQGNQLLFSQNIGFTQPSISRLFYKNSKNDKFPIPSFEMILSILNKYKSISIHWLILGEGQMLSNFPLDNKNNANFVEAKCHDCTIKDEKIERLNEKISHLQGIIDLKDKIIESKEEIINAQKLIIKN